jgi:hypothetical protein
LVNDPWSNGVRSSVVAQNIGTSCIELYHIVFLCLYLVGLILLFGSWCLESFILENQEQYRILKRWEVLKWYCWWCLRNIAVDFAQFSECFIDWSLIRRLGHFRYSAPFVGKAKLGSTADLIQFENPGSDLAKISFTIRHWSFHSSFVSMSFVQRPPSFAWPASETICFRFVDNLLAKMQLHWRWSGPGLENWGKVQNPTYDYRLLGTYTGYISK